MNWLFIFNDLRESSNRFVKSIIGTVIIHSRYFSTDEYAAILARSKPMIHSGRKRYAFTGLHIDTGAGFAHADNVELLADLVGQQIR